MSNYPEVKATKKFILPNNKDLTPIYPKDLPSNKFFGSQFSQFCEKASPIN